MLDTGVNSIALSANMPDNPCRLNSPRLNEGKISKNQQKDNRMTFKHALVISLAIIASACSTVTIHPKPIEQIKTRATYQDSKPFFLFGIVGEHHVNIDEICGDSIPLQMQTHQSFFNGFMTAITLGIYSPHIVRVWCK